MNYKLMFETKDGERYAGDTAFQVVDAMRMASSFTEHKELAEFMRGAAKRWSEFENVIVRADSPENFVADLVAGGILKEIPHA
jgi:hypothetical protein